MQIQTDVIGLKKSLSQELPISKSTEPAFLKPRPNVTKISLIVIKLNSSHGTFSLIVIELKIDRQHALSTAYAPIISNPYPPGWGRGEREKGVGQ